MIGNDIVCWQSLRDRSARRWDQIRSKILTPSEQKAWDSFSWENSMTMLWWTAKESAYKCWRQLGGERKWNPKSFQVRLRDLSELGINLEVYHEAYTFSGRAVWNEQYLFCELGKKGMSKPMHHIGSVVDQPSWEMRQHLLQSFPSAAGQVSIRSNKSGAPELWKTEQKMPVALSFTHHGSYWAYSYVSTSRS